MPTLGELVALVEEHADELTYAELSAALDALARPFAHLAFARLAAESCADGGRAAP